MSNNEPAFPIVEDVEHDSGYHTVCTHKGLTMRDWFAGQALAGILANVQAMRAVPPLTHAERADAAYQAADAMLRAREERQPAPATNPAR